MYKRLFRSTKSKVIGGVAGGLAEYFEIDPVIVRAAFVLSAFAWGISIPAYIIMWIITPVNPNQIEPIRDMAVENENPDISLETRKYNGRFIAGVLIICFGIFSLLHNLVPDFHFRYVWPILLIAIGIIIILYSTKNKNNEVNYEK
jgi:phage shock protein C